MLRLYARAIRGKRARGEKPQKKGINISMISALCLKEVLATICIYGAVDQIVFEGFILKEVVPKLWKGAHVVIDNAKIHWGEMLETMIEEAGGKLIHLSPYSPEFSPIENMWSKVKAILKKLKARTYKDLIDGVTSAILEVTPKNIHSWYTHCCYCTS